MSAIHYKFRSALEYKTLTFEGLHISVADLKRLIYENEKISRSADFDLQITNAQTKVCYEEDTTLVPRNASVVIARVPASKPQKLPKVWDRSTEGVVHRHRPGDAYHSYGSSSSFFEKVDLTKKSEMTEEEKLKEMERLSTRDYDPSKFLRKRGTVSGQAPTNYVCNRCGQTGHWINSCPMINIRRTTGIPKDELMETTPDDPQAMLTSTGNYVVSILHKTAKLIGKKEKPPFFSDEITEIDKRTQLPVMTSSFMTSSSSSMSPSRFLLDGGGGDFKRSLSIPQELVCKLCGDLLKDAVLIKCCFLSFCDDCIRSRLLESDRHECPACHAVDIDPDSLLPNAQLRQAVNNFRNETGYAHILRKIDESACGRPKSATPPTIVPYAVIPPTRVVPQSQVTPLAHQQMAPQSHHQQMAPQSHHQQQGAPLQQQPSPQQPIRNEEPPPVYAPSGFQPHQHQFSAYPAQTAQQQQQQQQQPMAAKAGYDLSSSVSAPPTVFGHSQSATSAQQQQHQQQQQQQPFSHSQPIMAPPPGVMASSQSASMPVFSNQSPSMTNFPNSQSQQLQQHEQSSHSQPTSVLPPVYLNKPSILQRIALPPYPFSAQNLDQASSVSFSHTYSSTPMTPQHHQPLLQLPLHHQQMQPSHQLQQQQQQQIGAPPQIQGVPHTGLPPSYPPTYPPNLIQRTPPSIVNPSAPTDQVTATPPGPQSYHQQPPPPGISSVPTFTRPPPVLLQTFPTRRPLTEEEFYLEKQRLLRKVAPRDAWEEFLERKDRRKRRKSSTSSSSDDSSRRKTSSSDSSGSRSRSRSRDRSPRRRSKQRHRQLRPSSSKRRSSPRSRDSSEDEPPIAALHAKSHGGRRRRGSVSAGGPVRRSRRYHGNGGASNRRSRSRNRRSRSRSPHMRPLSPSSRASRYLIVGPNKRRSSQQHHHPFLGVPASGHFSPDPHATSSFLTRRSDHSGHLMSIAGSNRRRHRTPPPFVGGHHVTGVVGHHIHPYATTLASLPLPVPFSAAAGRHVISPEPHIHPATSTIASYPSPLVRARSLSRSPEHHRGTSADYGAADSSAPTPIHTSMTKLSSEPPQPFLPPSTNQRRPPSVTSSPSPQPMPVAMVTEPQKYKSKKIAIELKSDKKSMADKLSDKRSTESSTAKMEKAIVKPVTPDRHQSAEDIFPSSVSPNIIFKPLELLSNSTAAGSTSFVQTISLGASGGGDGTNDISDETATSSKKRSEKSSKKSISITNKKDDEKKIDKLSIDDVIGATAYQDKPEKSASATDANLLVEVKDSAAESQKTGGDDDDSSADGKPKKPKKEKKKRHHHHHRKKKHHSRKNSAASGNTDDKPPAVFDDSSSTAAANQDRRASSNTESPAPETTTSSAAAALANQNQPPPPADSNTDANIGSNTNVDSAAEKRSSPESSKPHHHHHHTTHHRKKSKKEKRKNKESKEKSPKIEHHDRDHDADDQDHDRDRDHREKQEERERRRKSVEKSNRKTSIVKNITNLVKKNVTKLVDEPGSKSQSRKISGSEDKKSSSSITTTSKSKQQQRHHRSSRSPPAHKSSSSTASASKKRSREPDSSHSRRRSSHASKQHKNKK